MNGPLLLRGSLRHARSALRPFSNHLTNGLDGIDLFVPHQPSKVGLQAMEKALPAERSTPRWPSLETAFPPPFPSPSSTPVNSNGLRGRHSVADWHRCGSHHWRGPTQVVTLLWLSAAWAIHRFVEKIELVHTLFGHSCWRCPCGNQST